QSPPNLAFQRLQHRHVRIRIHTPHPRPVLRKAHHGALRPPRLPQQNPDIHELVLHRVRNIPHQEELTLLSPVHAPLLSLSVEIRRRFGPLPHSPHSLSVYVPDPSQPSCPIQPALQSAHQPAHLHHAPTFQFIVPFCLDELLDPHLFPAPSPIRKRSPRRFPKSINQLPHP